MSFDLNTNAFHNMAKTKQSLNIFSWNVNGIRAIQKKGFMDWFNKTKPDILCIQETKAHEEQLTDDLKNIKGYDSFWFSAQKKGYSSVATYSNIKPENIFKGFGVEKYDSEGRVLITEYSEFVLANVYFPNGGRGPERVKYKLDFYDELFFILEKK